MKTTFIVGRAGSGKSRMIFDRIAEREKAGLRSVLIVPDRATFESERALSERLGGGILYTYVLSFTSLARRVLSETGDARALLSSQGRQMLVRRTVEENASSLTAFSRVAKRRGFSEECDEIILRCKRFSISPDELFSACEQLPALFSGKLHDFALIYEKTLENMSEKYIDAEDLVNSLIERLPESSFRGAEAFIDAPDSMSEQSIRIISVLMEIMSGVTIALRMDTSEFCRDRRLFEPDSTAYMKLRDISREIGSPVEFISLGEQHRLTDLALRHLETNLFAFPAKAYKGSADNIELHTAGDRLHEVMAAAEELRMAAKNGLRYRDMAIIVSDLEGYANIIKRVFRMFEIPFFMDVKRPVSSHPVSELLLAALRCVEKGFSRVDFIRVIKTDLAGVSIESAERLENFILKYGINGRRLTEGFILSDFPNEREDILERIELARYTAAAPLMELKEKLGGLSDAKQRVEALFDYMQRLEIAQRLKENCEALAAAGKLDSARENAQVYDTVIELLDQLHIILGNDRIGLNKFRSVVEEGLKAYSVGIIPSTLDRVFIGDVDKSSVQSFRFIQVLGVNDGLLPKTKADNSIINDAELARLRKLGLSVWDSTESMNRSENLRVYSALAMATDTLRLSYCKQIGGKTAIPSQIIGKISDIFPNCKRTNGIIDPILGSTDAAAFKELTKSIRIFLNTDGVNPANAALYAHFAESADYSAALHAMDEAYFSDNSPKAFGQTAAVRLYGQRASGTATRLETFNQCPFRYYMQFGLGLRERDELKERSQERGSLIHEALDRLMTALIEEQVDFSFLTEDDIKTRLRELLPPIMAEHNNGIFLSSARMRAEFRRIVELLYTSGYALVHQIAAGKFRPVGSELSFGRTGDAFPPLEIETESGARFMVCGIVDRLDAFGSDEGEYIRIIDYKSGGVKFNFTELANGLKLQLPLYAAAMETALKVEKRARTAGFYYVHIAEPNAEADTRDMLREEIQKAFKMNGLTLRDEEVLAASDAEGSGWSSTIAGLRFLKDGGFSKSASLAGSAEMEKTLDFAKRTAANTLEAIMRGRAEVSPSRCNGKTACTYCPFISICRFDTTAGSRYRSIRAVTADEFFERG